MRGCLAIALCVLLAMIVRADPPLAMHATISGIWEYADAGRPCSREFTSDHFCTLRINGKVMWKYKWKKSGEYSADVLTPDGGKLDHAIQDDGSLLIEGKYIAWKKGEGKPAASVPSTGKTPAAPAGLAKPTISGVWEYEAGGMQCSREFVDGDRTCTLKMGGHAIWKYPWAPAGINGYEVTKPDGTVLLHILRDDGTLLIEGKYTARKRPAPPIGPTK